MYVGKKQTFELNESSIRYDSLNPIDSFDF